MKEYIHQCLSECVLSHPQVLEPVERQPLSVLHSLASRAKGQVKDEFPVDLHGDDVSESLDDGCVRLRD
jgi:hypothetical protein